MRNNNRKNIKFNKYLVFTAVLLVMTTSLCSCGLANFVVRIKSESIEVESSIIESESKSAVIETAETTDGVSDATQETETKQEINVDKSESKNPAGDKITSAGQPFNAISEVYYAVADSVVEITTETVKNSLWMGQYVSEGAGSGVIIDSDGFIVTNAHVISGANTVKVRLTNGREYVASVIGIDESADLAVIKINPTGENLTVAPLGCSADLVVGEDVVAIGNPLGSLGGTLTTGIISATERNMTINGEEMVLLQTNAAINPGNSGGGLFNMAGQLIGIVNAKAAGDDVEGLGFAIPVDFAHKVIEDLINYGYVRGVADHGLTLWDVTAQNLHVAYSYYGITTIGAVVIVDSAISDELREGDRLLSVNGVEIGSSADVERIMKGLSVGDEITVKVMRGRSTLEIKLKLAEKVPDTITFG